MRKVLVSAVAASLLLTAVAAAEAAPPLVRISGASPLARSCLGATAQRSSEVEPTLAADPRNPGVLVAAWQQDRYAAGGGAAALGVARSADGGATWVRARVPRITGCGGRHARNSD